MSIEPGTIRVVIASDSFLIGDGLAALFADVPDIEIIARTHDLDTLSGLAAEVRPNVLLICIRSLVVTTTALIVTARRLGVDHPDVGIVVVSDRDLDGTLDRLHLASANLALLADEELPGADVILRAIREQVRGPSAQNPNSVDCIVPGGEGVGLHELTPREVDILELMAHGLSNRAIAAELCISVKSIEKGVTSIFLKLGPFREGSSDRRVCASLAFLRTQIDPFGPVHASATAAPPISVRSRSA